MYNELYELWKKEKENENRFSGSRRTSTPKLLLTYKKRRKKIGCLDKKTTKAKLLDSSLKTSRLWLANFLSFVTRNFRKTALARETVARDALTEEEEKLYGEVLSLAEAYHAFSKDVLRGHLSNIEKDAKQT